LLFNSFFFVVQEENPDGDLIFYVLLRASNLFYNEHNRYPGADGNQILDGDVVSLKKHVNKLLVYYGINFTIKDDYLVEMYKGCEKFVEGGF
jgi:hypothetical protein